MPSVLGSGTALTDERRMAGIARWPVEAAQHGCAEIAGDRDDDGGSDAVGEQPALGVERARRAETIARHRLRDTFG